eukprot:ANDGO_04685.mRNA.1 putative ABC transporter ATP-binding protein/permease YOL075C
MSSGEAGNVRVSVSSVSLAFSVAAKPDASSTTAGSDATTTAAAREGAGENIVNWILKEIDVVAEPGQVVAILGGSGSGKTSLLDVIARRLVPDHMMQLSTMEAPEPADDMAVPASAGAGAGAGAGASVSVGVSVTGVLMDGQVFLNDSLHSELARSTLSSVVGYVPQNDDLIPHLTVRETLYYAAHLRLGANVSREEKLERIEKVIRDLGLRECADTLIGGESAASGGGASAGGRKGGCSGGEKRRVSIGIQLLANPKVLLLDECTSGLDAFHARIVVELLAKIAHEQNKTVIMSIHAPRADVFDLFDTIWLLTRGRLVYAGLRTSALEYFAQRGFCCPDLTNPADFLLDISSLDDRSKENEESSFKRVRFLVNQWSSSAERKAILQQTNALVAKNVKSSGMEGSTVVLVPLWKQLMTLMSRSFLNMRRDWMSLTGTFVESIVMGLILGYMFFDLSDSQAGIRSRVYAVYQAMALQTYIFTVFSVNQKCQDLRVFDRERKDGMYSVLPYALSEYVMMMLPPTVFMLPFSLIYYHLVGLRPGWDHFFIFYGIQTMAMWTSGAMAFMCSGLNRSFAVASLIANSFFTFISLGCGIFAQSDTLPVYIGWIQYVGFIYWGMRILQSNEFSNRLFDCPAGTLDCSPFQGNTVLRNFGFQPDDDVAPPLALAGMILGFFLLTVFVLAKVTPKPAVVGANRTQYDFSLHAAAAAAPTKSVPAVVLDEELEREHERERERDGDDSSSAGNRVATVSVNPADVVSVADVEYSDPLHDDQKEFATMVLDTEEGAISFDGAVVSLQNLRLVSVKKFANIDSPTKTKTILNNVNVTFRPGRLTVVLGASGAGKSSILNCISRRIAASQTLGTSIRQSGNVFVDGCDTLSVETLRSILAYVMQHDQLLPLLTVRETLHISAKLRLSEALSVEQKIQRAEDLIRILGLKSCADTRIGNELVRGISGGERRRVSIAVQLLSHPRILLADEPTSGLDAFTAHSIVSLLKALAKCGQTVITTLHQPRSDLFHLFDDILLMGKGGQVVYFGEAKGMLGWFANLGLTCPKLVNPADFFIDCSSVDYRTVEAEEESKRQLDTLVRCFAEKNRHKDDGQSAVGAAGALETTTTIGCGSGNAAQSTVRPATHAGGQRMAPFFVALRLLLYRSCVNLFRQPELCIARVFQSVSFAIILAIFFAPLSDNYYSIQNRIGLLNEFGALLFIGMLNCISVYVPERNVFYREEVDGTYSSWAFLWAYMLVEVPFEIVSCLVFTAFAGPVTGLQYSGPTFIILAFVVFCIMNVGESIGIIFCTMVQHVGFSVTLLSLVLSLSTVSAGLMSINFPLAIEYLNHISVLFYAAKVMAKNEFDGLSFTCNSSQQINGQCLYTRGQQVLDLYNMGNVDMTENIIVMFAVTLAYRIIAFGSLWFRSYLGRSR